MSERRNYFYFPTSPAMGPTPDELEQTVEHLTGRPPSSKEMAEMQQRLDADYSAYAPGGDVHRTTRRVIR